MKKLTDAEFEMMRRAMASAERTQPAAAVSGFRKLLANYQEQLEAESYVAAERYTEANCEPTVRSIDVSEAGDDLMTDWLAERAASLGGS